MKQYIFLFFALTVCIPLYAQITIPHRDADKIAASIDVASIGEIPSPQIVDQYLVFTASGSYRYVGIAFDYEQYRTIHVLERVVHTDADGKRMPDDYLFYAVKIPNQTDTIRYRMVFDGLWTTDPYNNSTEFDSDSGLTVSVAKIPYFEEIQTAAEPSGDVLFVFEGTQNQHITICGTFNNWDPYMYELEEITPGRYQISMLLPPGKYYYTFMNGNTRYSDRNNPERVYTEDGRIASVLHVPSVLTGSN